MKTKFTLLLSIFCLFGLQAFCQWTDNGSTIYTNDKVGIGTSSPAYQLHLYNSVRPEFYIGNPKGAVRMAVAYNSGDYAPTSQPGDFVYVIHAVDSNPNGVIFNFNNNDNNGNTYVKFCDWANNDIMAIYNNATVKIDGKLYAKEIEVKTNVWADYVFKPSYNLMPLTDLESFIKTNNHLPDVPTESEVKEKGINVADMNAKLLQKVEELTLYIIKQQKQIDELSQNMTSTSN